MERKSYRADELVAMPKRILEDGELLDRKVLNYSFPISERLVLQSLENPELNFLFQIDQSSKNSLKLSLHFMSKDSNTGLFRVDYCGSHKNPEEVTDVVPDDLKPFAGVIIQGNHVHYFIEGYDLKWAKPMEQTDYGCSEVNSSPGDVVKAILFFAETIALKTELKINQTIL